jgi:hypothetical protein
MADVGEEEEEEEEEEEGVSVNVLDMADTASMGSTSCKLHIHSKYRRIWQSCRQMTIL